jgi:hypothetical protein
MQFTSSLPFLIALLASAAATAQSAPSLSRLPASILPPVLPWSGASERLLVPKADPWITPAESVPTITTLTAATLMVLPIVAGCRSTWQRTSEIWPAGTEIGRSGYLLLQ